MTIYDLYKLALNVPENELIDYLIQIVIEHDVKAKD